MKKAKLEKATMSSMSLSDKEQKSRFTAMHVDELRRRTHILLAMNYPKDEVKKRFKAYVDDAYAHVQAPEYAGEIDQLVDEVYEKYGS